ncbi:MAG: hypothetical protein IPP48_01415 [Chitinophagaceae bacterium]|nr:hypothetical protein [Chitinophagaceae bacterium]
MGKFYYQFFLGVYNIGIRITAWWNPKAKKWVLGRKDIFSKLSAIDNNNNKQTVWMHCASVGEFEQGRPVLEKLKAENEKLKVVLTFFSPSGYEACKNYTIADNIFYLPMDSSVNAVRFLDIVKPSLVLWVKYEYWFYYLNEIKKRNIPLLLVSGVFRDDQPFFKWYGLFWKKMLYCFSHLFVQNGTSKNSLSEIGFEKNVTVSGDTRFDRVEAIANKFEPLPVIENFIGNNKVIVAGSTWEEDEELFIHFVNTHPQIKLILAPHEIDAENIKNIKKHFPGNFTFSIINCKWTTINYKLPDC